MESLEDRSGFDESIFVSEIPEYLHCVICTLVLKNPVQILACGHKMCEVCFQQIKTFSITANTELRCPVDRDLVDVNNVHEDKYLKRVIGNMVVRCRNHDQGCTWTADLSELETHFAQCSLKLQKSQDSETVLQLQQDIANLQQKNKVLEQSMSLITHVNKELQIKVQQQEKLQQAHQREMNMLAFRLETLERSMASSGNRVKHISSTSRAAPFLEKVDARIPKERIIIEHHCGDFSMVCVTNDNHRVVFGGESVATVSARSAVVPPRTKVWYEVEYTQCDVGGLNIVGWATNDLPTSETYAREWVGSGTHSYGFSVFTGYKYHNGRIRWGKKLTGETGVVGVALDLVKGKILISVGGQWTTPMGAAFTDVPTQKKFFPAITGWDSTLTFNFGDRSFKHAPPDSTYKTVINVFE